MISLVCAFSTHAAIVEQGRTRSIPDEGEDSSVAALAYDSKMINLFALIGNEIRKYDESLTAPIVSELHAIYS